MYSVLDKRRAAHHKKHLIDGYHSSMSRTLIPTDTRTTKSESDMYTTNIIRLCSDCMFLGQLANWFPSSVFYVFPSQTFKGNEPMKMQRSLNECILLFCLFEFLKCYYAIAMLEWRDKIMKILFFHHLSIIIMKTISILWIALFRDCTPKSRKAIGMVECSNQLPFNDKTERLSKKGNVIKWLDLLSENYPSSGINHRFRRNWLLVCFHRWRPSKSRVLAISRQYQKHLILYVARNDALTWKKIVKILHSLQSTKLRRAVCEWLAYTRCSCASAIIVKNICILSHKWIKLFWEPQIIPNGDSFIAAATSDQITPSSVKKKMYLFGMIHLKVAHLQDFV